MQQHDEHTHSRFNELYPARVTSSRYPTHKHASSRGNTLPISNIVKLRLNIYFNYTPITSQTYGTE